MSVFLGKSVVKNNNARLWSLNSAPCFVTLGCVRSSTLIIHWAMSCAGQRLNRSCDGRAHSSDSCLFIPPPNIVEKRWCKVTCYCPRSCRTGADPPLTAIPDSPCSLFGCFGRCVGRFRGFVAHSHCDAQWKVAAQSRAAMNTSRALTGPETWPAVGRETPKLRVPYLLRGVFI